MSLVDAIAELRKFKPKTEEEAQKFLGTLISRVQDQLIAAIYIGREHIHSTELRDDMEISHSYTSHISSDDYARIIWEKGDNIYLYFDKLEECARASDFDLNSI